MALSIPQICHQIQVEAILSLEACKADALKIEENLLLNKLHLEMVTDLFENKAKSGPNKKACESTYAILKSTEDTLNSLNITSGQGIGNSVKWIPLEIAFKRNIQTGIIKNLRHIDIKLFLDDSLVVFKDVMNNILREKGPVKVYTILVAEYQIQTDISSTADNKVSIRQLQLFIQQRILKIGMPRT